MMISYGIQQFLREMTQLNEVGCITVPRVSLDKLVGALNQSDLLVGAIPQPHRATYYIVNPQNPFPEILPPAVLIVTEEDYSADKNWQERVRNIAAYFLNVT